ncbi:MAG: ChbG/HpnK family deacetylase [Bacteroidia bacterium]|nr:ChbG/HpnK family deacetylase [Bacteroidia bacterium]MBP7713287.1 ChbG/HpnK family deacetylase [Bacteroidia bacterium]MBP8667164.1 ChbG/HpnK family deacetylase [Bacteroidia bacterium]HOZ82811.1 ChbG/HpnK family deacetylase [Bacteroidia bacterium]HOZ89445.1 ChbG/HpnK family deacetylase [Bacteroidia bacterium]
MPSLILTSDDFGLSKIFNQRMIELLQSNFLSSISIMINQVTSDQQNQIAEIKKMYAKNNFSLGLHLEVSEADDEATYQSQWNMFEQLLSIPPDYIDVHKGHFQNATFNSIAEFCLQKRVRFRKYKETTVNVSSPESSLTATFKELGAIKEWIANFKTNSTYELVFHIGSFDPDSKSSLNKDRELDIEKLKHVHEFISDKNISITNYKSL